MNATTFADPDPFARTPVREYEFGWPAKCLAGTSDGNMAWEPFECIRRTHNLRMLYRGVIVNIFVAAVLVLATFNACARLQRDFQSRFSIATLLGVTLFVALEMWTRGSIIFPASTRLSNLLVDYSNFVIRVAILLSCVYYPNVISAKLSTNRTALKADEN